MGIRLKYKNPNDVIADLKKIAKELDLDPKKAVRFYLIGLSHGTTNMNHRAIILEARKYMSE